jgi:hypothetical protein
VRAVASIVVVGIALAGCGSGERIAECDRLLEIATRASTCGKLDRAQRLQIENAVTTMRDALDKLEDVGVDRAPPAAVTTTRQSCAKQAEDLRQMYEKLAPECTR